MTIVAVNLSQAKDRLEFLSDSRLSGSAATESGAKIFRLPVRVVAARPNDRFQEVYRTAYGFAFAGSTLAALNTHAYSAACLENLLIKPDCRLPSLNDAANLIARVAKAHIMDVVSRSDEGLSNAPRYFFQALVGGYCDSASDFELYQIQPALQECEFDVVSVKMDVAPNRFFAIGSATDVLVELSNQMAEREIARGVYGAMELLLALGGRSDIGGWIQYGAAYRGGFQLRPTMRPNLSDPNGPVEISFMGFDSVQFGDVGDCSIGYQVIGPTPPVDWLAEALQTWNWQ